ncbi:MAG: RNA-binding S4 domain-containing protein [Salipiger marinus]|uniref:RNA-binding S4 domain-containing protein n=1 Tax=Salipiger marinus TaxID=555512 RepID=UPI0040594126
MAADPDSPPLKLRIDKWLWQARFFKTRSLAAKAVSGGLRVNGTSVSKPAFAVGPGDVLTFTQARAVRVIRIAVLGDRRGPAPEAQALYEDLAPPQADPPQAQAPRYDGGGRPTKRDRRMLDRSRDVLE